jgi:hypothetical protein
VLFRVCRARELSLPVSRLPGHQHLEHQG